MYLRRQLLVCEIVSIFRYKMEESNTITCQWCKQQIDLDQTDWCDTCDKSIFDDRSDLSDSERRGYLLKNMMKMSEYLGEYDTDEQQNVWIKMVQNGFTSCAGARKFVIDNRKPLKQFLDLFKDEDGVIQSKGE